MAFPGRCFWLLNPYHMKKITIGITDCSKWDNYRNWIEGKDTDILLLSASNENAHDVDRCNGIILSGGEDVHPKYYGHKEWMNRKDELKLSVNEQRDIFEMAVLKRAMKRKLPVLGICRGLQITNVFLGGTLIPDLDQKVKATHSKCEGIDMKHHVKVIPGSHLSKITNVSSGIINSAHHQAADQLGKGLIVSAISTDGTIEALEHNEKNKEPFLLLVQWHPERMKNKNSPLSREIKKRFLKEVRLFSAHR